MLVLVDKNLALQVNTFSKRKPISHFNIRLNISGSCMPKFSTMPVVRCDINDKCSYAQNSDISYWLSTSEPMTPSMLPVSGDKIRSHISRCSVCESTGNVIKQIYFKIS